MKIPKTKTNKNHCFFVLFKKKKKSKTLQEQGRKTITTFCTFCVKLSDELGKEKKKEQEA